MSGTGSSSGYGYGSGYGRGRRGHGYTGLLGSVFFLFAFLSMMWGAIDPNTNTALWFALSVEFIGGLLLSIAFGFQVARRTPLADDINAMTVGIIAGAVIIGVQSVILLVGGSLSYVTYGEGLWLTMLAPVAETMAFDVFIYELFRFHFPRMHWLLIAIPSNIAFMFFHFFHYGATPMFLLILLVLFVGNTILLYIYHATRNAASTFVAHTVVNINASGPAIYVTLLSLLPMFIVMFIILLFIYIIIGGLRI